MRDIMYSNPHCFVGTLNTALCCQAEQGKTDMENYIAKLEEEKAGLEKEVSDLKITCQMVEKRAQEQKLAEEKKHGEEINFLKRTNQQLKAQLEGIIAQKK
jgi:dynein light intermediate chain, axonemal